MDLAIRLEHESMFHENTWFVTATYADEYLPYGGSLNHNHISEMIRGLRDKLRPIKIRFFGVGEYGGILGRPHYHFIIFGPEFADKEKAYFKPSNAHHSDAFQRFFGRGGFQHYKSGTLTKVWKKGEIHL